MKKIICITDYKGNFGSKWKSKPYRSGYDKPALSHAFAKYNIDISFMTCSEVNEIRNLSEKKTFLYTSTEEVGNNYKSFIEDTVFGLEAAGETVIPPYKFLRAHNNKVSMEILRDKMLGYELTGLESMCFGSLAEVIEALKFDKISFPCVIKPAIGAMSKGVELAKSPNQLLSFAKKISRSVNFPYEIKDYLRQFRPSIKGYKPESRYQKKFIVQPFIRGLGADWKVLVYFDQFYALKRHVRPGDFRASGSHFNYLAGSAAKIPDAALDMVQQVYEKLNVPHLSADVAFDGTRPYLLEFQCVFFGTSTHAEFCNEYAIKLGNSWYYSPKKMNQEEIYAYGVAEYLKKQRSPK